MPKTAAKPKNKRRVRFNGRRFLLVAASVYVVVGAAVSAWHILALMQQERRLASQIAAVEAENRALRADLRQLANPVSLKAMLTGRKPLPDANVNPPPTLP
jgi:cell division protein FtsB